MAEESINSAFFKNHMSDWDKLKKHSVEEDESTLAKEAILHSQLAGESRAVMDHEDPRAVEVVVISLNHGQHLVFGMIDTQFQDKILKFAVHQVEVVLRNCVLFVQALWEPAVSNCPIVIRQRTCTKLRKTSLRR